MMQAEGVSLAKLKVDSAEAEKETGVRPTLTYTDITCEHTPAVHYTHCQQTLQKQADMVLCHVMV